jgi:hypothetical protein
MSESFFQKMKTELPFSENISCKAFVPSSMSFRECSRSDSKFGSIISGSCGPGSSVGIATGYGLESNPGGGEIFRTCPDRPWSPSSLLYNGYRVFPGGRKRPGRDADSSPLLVPRSKNTVGLYLYSP